MEYSTRWFEAYPIKKANSATLKGILLNDFLPRYGYGCKITSDQDRAFVLELMKNITKDADLKMITTIAPITQKQTQWSRCIKKLKKKILFLKEQKTREEDKHEN
jgi:hypothetical protein